MTNIFPQIETRVKTLADLSGHRRAILMKKLEV
jgi:hypothetical protein